MAALYRHERNGRSIAEATSSALNMRISGTIEARRGSAQVSNWVFTENFGMLEVDSSAQELRLSIRHVRSGDAVQSLTVPLPSE